MKELCHLGKAGILKVISLHLFTALVEGVAIVFYLLQKKQTYYVKQSIYNYKTIET